MKVYDLIFELLQTNPANRDSDKKLVWNVYTRLGYVKQGSLHYFNFMLEDCPSTETIRRCRQKIQELHPELRASLETTRIRKNKARDKGTFIYRTQSQGHWEYQQNIARWVE